MEIGAYLFLAGIVWLVGLALRPRVRRRLAAYAGLSLLLALAGLILFYLLSAWAGFMRTGVTGSLSIPQDYLARGAAGVAILLVGLAGLLSPLLAAWLLGRSMRTEGR
jgi:drug/metabolite transporter (DMT)-like permease